jgi:hypothetical protein
VPAIPPSTRRCVSRSNVPMSMAWTPFVDAELAAMTQNGS